MNDDLVQMRLMVKAGRYSVFASTRVKGGGTHKDLPINRNKFEEK